MRRGLCQAEGMWDFLRSGLRPPAQAGDGGIRSGEQCQSAQEEGLDVEPQRWDRLPQERKTASELRLVFNPQICSFSSLCDRDSLVNLSDPWFPFLQGWVMITILRDDWRANQIEYVASFEPCKCPCVSFGGSCLGGDWF